MKRLMVLAAALAAQCVSLANAGEKFIVPADLCAWQFEAYQYEHIYDGKPPAYEGPYIGNHYGTVLIPKDFTKPWPVGNAFEWDLEAFEVESGNPCYKAVDGVLYYKGVADEGWTLVQFPAGRRGGVSHS